MSSRTEKRLERDAVVRVQTGGEVALVRVALDGGEAHTVVTGGTRACASVAARGRRVLFSAFGFTEPGDLYLVDLDTEEERRLTRLNEDVLPRPRSAERRPAELLEQRRSTGRGLVPAAGRSGGTPTHAAQHPRRPARRLGRPFQLRPPDVRRRGVRRAARQPSGLDRGRHAFATAIEGDWGNLDYADLMAGVDHAIDEGLGDPDRLGVFGISGGGNLTGWVIGHTDRFKAALLAITYADRCTAPTLFLQHESDYPVRPSRRSSSSPCCA